MHTVDDGPAFFAIGEIYECKNVYKMDHRTEDLRVSLRESSYMSSKQVPTL